MLRRKKPWAPSPGTQWPPEVRRQIVVRDGGRCVAPRLGWDGDCYGYPELDHVRASGALGMKSRSTVDNGALLCAVHHAWKTAHGRQARPALLAYIDRATPQHRHVELVFGCPDCEEIRQGMSA